MSIYALSISGSNYFAPVISGFISQYQSWEWVFYYPSIFLAVVFLFLFFFLEETNYDRTSGAAFGNGHRAADSGALEKDASQDNASTHIETLEPRDDATPTYPYKKKGYWRKLSLWNVSKGQNAIFLRLWQSLYLLTWPVILYCGFVRLLPGRVTTDLSEIGSHTVPISFGLASLMGLRRSSWALLLTASRTSTKPQGRCRLTE